MRLSAFCNIEFLQRLALSDKIDYMDEADLNRKHHTIEMMRLIWSDLYFETDASEDLLESSAQANPLLKHLMKSNRIFSVPSGCNRAIEEYSLSADLPSTCLYLVNRPESECRNTGEKLGHFVLSPESDFSVIFNEKLHSFNLDENVSWNFAESIIGIHNSIVIVDSYLYTVHNREYYLKFLRRIAPKQLRSPYKVTLIGKSRTDENSNLPKKEEIDNWSKTIAQTLNRMNIDVHIYDGRELHDRMIITNNSIVLSGIGLSMFYGNEIKRDSSWVGLSAFKNINGSKDRVFYFMQKKLQTISNWIMKSNNPKSSNPLITNTNLSR